MILTGNDLDVAIAKKIIYNYELYFCLFLSSLFNYFIESNICFDLGAIRCLHFDKYVVHLTVELFIVLCLVHHIILSGYYRAP